MQTCQDCGVERRTLHRHHILPRCEGGTDEPANIVRLCANCHEDRHGGLFGGELQSRLSNSPQARVKKSASLREFYASDENRQRLRERRREQWSGAKGDAIRAKMGRIARPSASALLAAYERCGSIRRTAEELGAPYATVQLWLTQEGIHRPVGRPKGRKWSADERERTLAARAAARARRKAG